MSKIKGRNTLPEITLRKAIWRLGYRYKINDSSLPGKPDILFNKYKLIVFVDGEFWHGYNWELKKRRIKSNRDYWIKKIERNIERDKENSVRLKNMGYSVLRFWEHEINGDIISCITKIIEHIESFKKSN